jgi:adenylyltransferase/sulfurtransferase
MTQLQNAKVLLIGAGGLGSAAALVLARTGIGSMTVVDDDDVDESNLHRQTLFSEEQIGQPKVLAAATRLVDEARAAGHALEVGTQSGRLLPDNARKLIDGYDLILEGADNFATKFLCADACALAGIPVVQAGAVRWNGWTLASWPGATACMRCVFEDMPTDRADTCAEAGVIGPVVGLLGAAQASLALRLLETDITAAGELWSYDGRGGKVRRRRVHRRDGCRLCSGEIRELRADRYDAARAA